MARPSDTELDTTQRGDLREVRMALSGRSVAWLVITHGEGVGRQIELREQPMIVGRASECEIRLMNRAVSRLHCRVWKDQSGYWLRDLNSTNKTYLNDRPIVEARLKDQDLIMVGGTTLRFIERSEVQEEARNELFDMAVRDASTGLYNRPYFEVEAEREHARCQRKGRPFILALLDVEGMPNQGEVTKGGGPMAELGRMILAALRRDDTPARLQGARFALLLPETTLMQARDLLSSLRSAIENTTFDPANGGIRLRVAVGAHMVDERTASIAAALASAEQALHRAKLDPVQKVHIATEAGAPAGGGRGVGDGP